MNKAKFIATTIALTMTIPLLAKAADEATQTSASFSSLDILLGLLAFAQVFAILTISGVIRGISNTPELIEKLRKSVGSESMKAMLILVFSLGMSLVVSAQTNPAVAQTSTHFNLSSTTIVLLVVNGALLCALLYVYGVQRQLVAKIVPPEPKVKAEAKQAAEKQSTLSKVLIDAVPLDQEDEIMLDHDYDGIRELDNNLPPWWVWMFYATIAYAVIYLLYYDVLNLGMDQQQEYIAELKQAQIDKEAYLATQKKAVDENTVVYLDDPKDLAAGKNIFTTNCQACHAPDGGGGVGPNFTDKYWLHGGSIHDIFKTIKYGVPTKGMIAWESQLNPTQIAQVASYVKSLGGTTPANPKEPQGEIWEPEASPEAIPDSVKTEREEVSGIETKPDKITASLK